MTAFRVHRNPDGSLPHIGLGGPARSMYDADRNTINDHARQAEIAATLLASALGLDLGPQRDPIRVQAEVGEAISEVEAP
jgi:hypothetical protein